MSVLPVEAQDDLEIDNDDPEVGEVDVDELRFLVRFLRPFFRPYRRLGLGLAIVLLVETVFQLLLSAGHPLSCRQWSARARLPGTYRDIDLPGLRGHRRRTVGPRLRLSGRANHLRDGRGHPRESI